MTTILRSTGHVEFHAKSVEDKQRLASALRTLASALDVSTDPKAFGLRVAAEIVEDGGDVAFEEG